MNSDSPHTRANPAKVLFRHVIEEWTLALAVPAFFQGGMASLRAGVGLWRTSHYPRLHERYEAKQAAPVVERIAVGLIAALAGITTIVLVDMSMLSPFLQ